MEVLPCDPEIFKKGKSIAALDAKCSAAEEWVKAVAKEANAPVDWHYSGGVANVLYFGNREVGQRVVKAIDNLENILEGKILRVFNEDASGLYRKGVTPIPEGAVAAFYEPGLDQSIFMIEKPNTISQHSYTSHGTQDFNWRISISDKQLFWPSPLVKDIIAEIEEMESKENASRSCREEISGVFNKRTELLSVQVKQRNI